ncbi:MAG: chemotaxis-specific protein-glutamate methyltransferase CheB [Clostridia bacterium]|nr:chemotaxis-specific protein-glutamate methyltransferase CheB [Deltaproteobacteria bacterium]
MLLRLLASDPEIEVAGVAENGAVALELLAEVEPDLIILDIEMPTMDGPTMLREMRKRALTTPVLVFSSLSQRGALVTIEALASGAADYVTKPSGLIKTSNVSRDLKDVLLEKIHVLAGRFKRRTTTHAQVFPPIASTRAYGPIDAVAIGVSTGGPQALGEVLPMLPKDLRVPMFIVQHMPKMFTEQLARTLDYRSQVTVIEGLDNGTAEPGVVYIAPGGRHMRVRRDHMGQVRIALSDEAPLRSCRPSVDLMFESFAKAYGARGLGVILTGMGNDGLEGSRAIRHAGGDIFAQDEESSVVWGMPGEVVRNGLASNIAPLREMAEAIRRRVR